jgi:uncharacterized protein YdiU (UPF0061 family)
MVPDSDSTDTSQMEGFEGFLERMADCIPKKPTDQKKSEVKQSFRPWLKTYAKRVLEEDEHWQTASEQDQDWQEYRCEEMRKVNPRFVLRQWLLEETIKKLEEGEGLERRRVLAHILKVCPASRRKSHPRSDMTFAYLRWQPIPLKRTEENY